MLTLIFFAIQIIVETIIEVPGFFRMNVSQMQRALDEAEEEDRRRERMERENARL